MPKEPQHSTANKILYFQLNVTYKPCEYNKNDNAKLRLEFIDQFLKIKEIYA